MSKKFSLDPDPTFKANVQIPVPGKGAAAVEFIFKYRDSDEYNELVDKWKDGNRTDVDAILEIASGWNLADPFDEASIEKMVKRYQGSAAAILKKYVEELTGARLGN